MDVSLIIPTSNRAQQLAATLTSISLQHNLAGVEVIVVDNGSVDNTREIVAGFNGKIAQLVYEYDAMPGLLTGRHRGIELSKSEVLCFLDDDVLLNRDYTIHLKQLFSDQSVHFATGPCLPKFEIDPPEWLDHFWEDVDEGRFCGWLSLINFGKKQRSISPMFVFGLNFCGRKATIQKLGGFHPDCIPSTLQVYQGDGETGLAFKALAGGFKTIYEPGLGLLHDVPKERLTTAYFLKRAFYQGVCNSFTDLRKQYLPQEQHTTVAPQSLKKRLRSLLYYIYWFLKTRLTGHKKPQTTIPEDVKQMKEVLTAEEQAGYDFHQAAFRTDEKVKTWVLKENYWNYKLPSH